MKGWLARQLQRAWYGESGWTRSLSPLERIYRNSAERERVKGQLAAESASVGAPVIVVGNLTVGGTGKSPVVAALAQYFQQQGYRPGILSRGYGANLPDKPTLVHQDSNPLDVGDEPVMLARQTGCALVVDRDRVRGANYLVDSCLVNLVICDDGLQHYRLPRDIEILVLDGTRGLGNQRLLPVGPLREPVDRWRTVDFLLCNGDSDGLPGDIRRRLHASFRLQPTGWLPLAGGDRLPLEMAPVQGEVIALSGIGNPERFHASLARLGLKPKPRSFGDHHRFQRKDLQQTGGLPVVMTSKDAVKCRQFYEAEPGLGDALPPAWALQVEARLPQAFLEGLSARVAGLVQKGDTQP